MKSYGFNLLLALSAGMLGVIQGMINAHVGKGLGQYGMIIGVSAVQVIVASLAVWRFKSVIFQPGLWPWIIVAGILGVAIMFGVSYATGSVGALSVFILMIAGQIIASAVIDHFGLMGLPRNPFTLSKLGSILIIMTGVWCLMKSSG
ncbi:DMT family transporter [Cohnella endophytica]|uniref:DMT family transporter n=1 Tax=Cohnella endophytica TaxID=2419778 RepID=A0A494XH53_9BACL|nr:DMT family transporter [Cohnella endophytica]RKP49980.1 DMT family transporter [Cohnella endophytica]